MKLIFKRIAWIFIVAILVLAGCTDALSPHSDSTQYSATSELARSVHPGDNWQLVWEDDFSHGYIDHNNWGFDLGDGSIVGIPGWGNNELQYYTDNSNNVFVRNNRLVIRAVRENRSDELGSGSYTSGRLVTRGLHSWTYGRFEARISLPVGQGLWPAFWMLPEPDGVHGGGQYGGWAASGEIDIMEARGSNPSQATGAIHYGGEWPANTYQSGSYTLPSGSIENFHTYAIEWEPGEIRWYVDDHLYYTANEWYSENGEFPAPFDQPSHILLNLAVGGWFDGDPPAHAPYFPAEMEVDYVRVYQTRDSSDPDPVDPTGQQPYLGQPHPIPGRIQAQHFDLGGQDIAFNETSPTNQGGAYRHGEPVDIEATTDPTGGNYNVGWINTGEWLEYTVKVSSAGSYNLHFRVASAAGGGAMRARLNGNDLTGQVSFNSTGGWQNWITVTVSNVQLNPGTQILRLEMEDREFNINWVEFEQVDNLNPGDPQDPDDGFNYTGTLPNGLINGQPVAYTTTASYNGQNLVITFNGGPGFEWIWLFTPGHTSMEYIGSNTWQAELSGYTPGDNLQYRFTVRKDGQEANNVNAQHSWIVEN